MSFESSTKDHGQKRYQIAISRDGNYAVTFDTETLQVKILKNTDHRKFFTSKVKKNVESSEQNVSNGIDEIDKTVASLQLKEDLFIADKNERLTPRTSNDVQWSIDISNIDEENFIFIAVSRLDKFMEKTGENNTRDEKAKMVVKKYYNGNNGDARINCINCIPKDSTDFGTAIYCLELKNDDQADIIKSNFNRLSGICKFVEAMNPEEFENDVESDYILKKFLLLNHNGIYSFKYNKKNKSFNDVEKFNYPDIVTKEFNALHDSPDMNEIKVTQESIQDYMNLILSHINKKYFLVEVNKVLEVHDLTEMRLKTSVKSIYNNKYNNYKYKKVYSIDKQKLQICISLGPQTIGIFLMEHGSEIAIKTFEKINILLIEFINSDEKLLLIGSDTKNNNDLKIIIWDIYDTDNVETIALKKLTTEHLSTCLASTSGNLLQVNDEGKVTSILKMIETITNKLKNNNSENSDFKEYILNNKEPSPSKKLGNHTIYFYENYVNDNNFEPAVKEPEPWVTKQYEKISFYLYNNHLEVLQLIVGMSTIQIWHQFHDKNNEKKNLPNEGKPFLEFIWTNGIPENQENEYHKLHISNVRFGSKFFRLEVYWYEKEMNNQLNEEYRLSKEIITEKMKNMEDIKGMKIKKKIIEWNDINENAKGIRYACEALESLNMHAKSLTSYDKTHKYNEMVKYINHIVWRYTAKRPQRYRLLDVRYRIMKNLILGNCNHLIHYLLFGFSMDLYIPKHYKPNDAMIVTYILEYYVLYADDFVSLLKTVSDAYFLLNILKYEECTRMLKNEWHTFEKDSSKDSKTLFEQFQLLISKLKSPDYDIKSSRLNKVQRNSDYTLILKHILLFLFIPRWYKTNQDESNLIPYEDIDDMFDLPVIEKTIQHRWPSANSYVFFLFLRFFTFGLCFMFISFVYIGELGEISAKGLEYFIYLLIGIFYYLAIYLLITELMQLTHHGFIKYLSIVFNWFDLLSIVIPVAVMTAILIKSSKGFGSPEAKDLNLIVGISYSILIIWIQLILYFRLIPIAAYFWTNSNWIQRDLYTSWSVEIFTIIASILIVIILQNMLIAIMGNVYESAAAKSKQAVLKYKAIQISDYEDLQHRFDFWYQDPDFVPSKEHARNFKNAIHQDKYISEFAKDLDYDQDSIWKFE
ncbi:2807_t:CDS:10 [Funneliformis caledonium]|uniref:2807_t:CDS:1 n=1 Tax=Funneliformis caledonium TaxID=1117310 RepID=A0A9N9C267_9GLOM|nr:2807_t:CDS:10 [Funneliformis caledonium]